MPVSVKSTHHFLKEAKQLHKKYPSIYEDVRRLISSLEVTPQQGTPLGKGLYKIRLTIKSKQKGKSGDARVITYVKILHEMVYLATIYDKAEKEDISCKELDEILKEL